MGLIKSEVPFMRKTVIAGNWKMNQNQSEARSLIAQLKPLAASAACDVICCVPFTSIASASEAASGSNIKIGAQNCHWATSGAFTGEISAGMLAEMGVEYVIIGHSERRQYFGESDQTVNARLRAALDAGLTTILCVGELLEQREAGITQEICSIQTKIALSGVSHDELSRIIIAYEPVWAIGTGKTATSEQADEACACIREVVAGLYDKAAAEALTIQYGGSMNAGNAAELLAKPNVDGGLIGGASLKAEDFAIIVNAVK